MSLAPLKRLLCKHNILPDYNIRSYRTEALQHIIRPAGPGTNGLRAKADEKEDCLNKGTSIFYYSAVCLDCG